MPIFLFVARDPSGRQQRGTREGPSAAAVVSQLRGRGWLVLEVRAATDADRSLGDTLALLNPFAWLPPRSVDVELSLLQMAVMLRSGLTLLTAIKTIAEQARRRSMRLVWEEVGRRITEGSSLGDAMAAHRCFGQLALQLVRVGEQTGTLEQVTARAADILERRRNLRTSLLTALSYPFIVLVAAIGVAAFMVFNVIPKLQKFLSTLGRKLPAMTQMLVDVTEFLNNYLPHILIGMLALIVAVTLLYLWPPGRLWIDRVLLRLPVLGGVLRLSGTAMFARGLGILVRSGITLLEGLRTVEGLHRNRFLATRVAAAREAVMQGGGLAEPLSGPGAFMPMLSRMVAVGEATGTLDDVLDEVARFHEAQLQATIRWLSLIIEPLVIIVVGSIVGFVYIAFFLALFSAGGGIR